MITGFRCKRTERIFQGQAVKGFSLETQRAAKRKLAMMEAAVDLSDLRSPPSNHLEKLRKDRAGQHSIRVNKKWRICFVARGGQFSEVEIVDYH